jgi:hypothetical protein
MMKTLALAASITMLVAISGQALAGTAAPQARYWPKATPQTGKWDTSSMLSIRRWRRRPSSRMRTAIMADRNRTIDV